MTGSALARLPDCTVLSLLKGTVLSLSKGPTASGVVVRGVAP